MSKISTYGTCVRVLYPLSLLFIGIFINYINAYGLIHCYNVQNYNSYLPTYIHTQKNDIINKMVKTVLPVGQTVESDSFDSITSSSSYIHNNIKHL